MKQTPLKRHTPLRATKPMKRGGTLRGITNADLPDGVKLRKPLKATTIKPSARRMKQGKGTPAPTAADNARWDAMLSLGCICCRRAHALGLARASFATRRPELEIHHITDTGRRISHAATLCLCHYHHQGKKLPYLDAGYKAQAERFGPSLGRGKRLFVAVYGTEMALLEFQNRLLVRAQS